MLKIIITIILINIEITINKHDYSLISKKVFEPSKLNFKYNF